MATSFTEITFSKIKTEIENYLKAEYSKSNILYSEASPYGQILFVVENLFQLAFLYLKNAIKQFDLSDANSNNPRNIRNAAVVAGHIPGRAISSTGAIKLTPLIGGPEIPGNRISFFNRQAIKNKTNSLQYAIMIGTDKTTYSVDNNTVIYLNIIQGVWSVNDFTGTGEANQTFNVTARSSNQDIENFNVEVLVNGNYWAIKKHTYDLLPDEEACVVRTGYSGGIDVIFGNGGFGKIPAVASSIKISYILTDGSNGNIFRRTPNDWTFIDPCIDGFGNTLDITKNFNIEIFNDINFGADKESIQFTKNILPISSNNFVLGLPEQYAYAIKRLGVFSHVNAYEQYGVIYIVCTPNIVLFKNQNSDYFSVPLAAFSLDNYEKSKIDIYLRTGGNIMLTKRYVISSPIISQYIINVFITTYSDAQDDAVNSQIYNAISEYFLNFNRIDKVPKVDIVTRIAAISDIDSVDISFVSKKNEDYHRANLIKLQNLQSSSSSTFKLNNTAVQTSIGYTASQVIGLDPVLGDILFEPNEIPVIRGGFFDRNSVYYSDDLKSLSPKTVNIFKKGTVDVSQKTK